jgi:triacylglycerol lipase
LVSFAQRLINAIAIISSVNPEDFPFDFKLDHWGLQRRQGETVLGYMNRLWGHTFWRDTKDISAWDLSPDGAAELNSWVRAAPGVYYFSWATEGTQTNPLTGHQDPEVSMNPIMVLSAFFMGRYTSNEPGHILTDESWWQNDGVVNTNSMDGPTFGSEDEIVDYDGVPRKGKWNYMGLVESFDHTDIIGMPGIVVKKPIGFPSLKDWYLSIAGLLRSLPE